MIKHLAVAVLFLATSADAARVKDIAQLSGIMENELIGYGLVVGLAGTGDSPQALFANQSVAAMLSTLGTRVDARHIRTRNVAGVVLTSRLPAFASPGARIDVVVSSLGDAKSLVGGTLVLSSLRGVDLQIYAIAQGPLTVAGFTAASSGTSVTKNHPTVGRIPGGATIQRPVGAELNGRKELVYVLKQADFTTASNVAKAITAAGVSAHAVDSARIVVAIPEGRKNDVVGLVAQIELASVEMDAPAKVILDARSGTVVMGANVRVGAVALAHGNLQLEVESTPEVSQPGAFSRGDTAIVNRGKVKASEPGAVLHVVKGGATLDDLVRALNALGVSPRDLIDILQAIRAAGALNAELEVL